MQAYTVQKIYDRRKAHQFKSGEAPARMRERILLVEDEPLSRKSTGLFLRDIGYHVQEANDGAEALSFLETVRFDLVLSDIRMPRVNGVAVIARLRSISPDTPFIVVTASVQDVDGLSTMPRSTFMIKPILFDDLETKIQLLLHH